MPVGLPFKSDFTSPCAIAAPMQNSPSVVWPSMKFEYGAGAVAVVKYVNPFIGFSAYGPLERPPSEQEITDEMRKIGG